MPRKELDPDIHPTAPERMRAWHNMMLGKQSARRTWPILVSHHIFELRECPVCKRPVMRWRQFDEVKQELFVLAVRLSRGNKSLAARRLNVSRDSLSDHLPPDLGV